MLKLLFGFLIAWQVHAKTPREGVYMLTGNASSRPEALYFGSVTITEENATYHLKWKIGESQTQTGVAILVKDVLSVGYLDDSGKDFGVVSYQVKTDKKLEGKWAPLGATRAGRETLEWIGPDVEDTHKKLQERIQKAELAHVQKYNSLENLENRLALEADSTERFYLMTGILRHYSANKIANKKAAQDMAEEVLKVTKSFKENWNYGNAVHHSNLVLGRLSLMSGDKDKAKTFLKAAGKTPGSPQLNTFGPNMTLAQELLEKGEKQAVLDYFDDIKKFWKAPVAGQFIAEWKEAIAKGKTPNFGANLVY